MPHVEGTQAGWAGRKLRLREVSEEQLLCGEMARHGLVGRSQPMVALFQWIRKASVASDLPVLITGETGSGKELVARALHSLDPKRCAGPFVPVNCIALSRGVADSELFGHRRGSFTGATEDHRGFFRSADRGVLFLDEVADLDMPLQGKLLRVLQESRVRGVGEDREVVVNVRVVAATNMDVETLVTEKRFRLDLYQRLNVLEVRLPPLLERRDDIALLVEYFVEKHASLRRSRPLVHEGFVKALADMALPGNVRQLENLVRRALALGTDGTPLGAEDIPPKVTVGRRAELASAVSPGEPPGIQVACSELLAQQGSLCRCLDACERAIVRAALDSTHGSPRAAARLLGITARGLYNKRRRHRL